MYGYTLLLAQFSVAVPTYVGMMFLVGGDRLDLIREVVRRRIATTA
jgi:hypothetical protein